MPRIGISDERTTSSFTRKLSEGRKLFRVVGEIWRDEWVEPGTLSTRIHRDRPDPSISFTVDAAGKKQTAEALKGGGGWLWFKPELIPARVARRGGPERWGSLKSLERVLATLTEDQRAQEALGPLQGIYNLRIADAHATSQELDEAYALAGVDRTLPFVMQGRDLLTTCMTSLHRIAGAFR